MVGAMRDNPVFRKRESFSEDVLDDFLFHRRRHAQRLMHTAARV
jgi:hypothetical protein